AGKGQAHFLLAVGVGTGGVEIGDAGVVGFAQEHPGVFGGDTLDGQSAKAVLVHSDAGAAQGDSLHGSTSFLKKIEGKKQGNAAKSCKSLRGLWRQRMAREKRSFAPVSHLFFCAAASLLKAARLCLALRSF